MAEELYEPTSPDHDCICEDAERHLFNPDCYWHGTEGVETEKPAKEQA